MQEEEDVARITWRKERGSIKRQVELKGRRDFRQEKERSVSPC